MVNTITSISAALVALATLLTAVVAVWRNLKKDLSVIHVLVNSQLTTVVSRVEQLSATMRKEGVAIPPEHGKMKIDKGNGTDASP